MQDFAGIRQVEATIEAVDDGEEATAGSLERANRHYDHVGVRHEVDGVADSVVDLARAQDLLGHAQRDLARQELDHLVADVEGREKYQIPFHS